jgi:hypothetical protein
LSKNKNVVFLRNLKHIHTHAHKHIQRERERDINTHTCVCVYYMKSYRNLVSILVLEVEGHLVDHLLPLPVHPLQYTHVCTHTHTHTHTHTQVTHTVFICPLFWRQRGQLTRKLKVNAVYIPMRECIKH